MTDARRRRRLRSRPRSKTIAVKKLTKAVLRAFNPFDYVAELAAERPKTRGDCVAFGTNAERPCPWVACKHHLYLDIQPDTGNIKFNFPDLEPWELHETCSIDVGERGGATLDEVGQLLNVTRERARQLEVRGLLKLKRDGALDDVAA